VTRILAGALVVVFMLALCGCAPKAPSAGGALDCSAVQAQLDKEKEKSASLDKQVKDLQLQLAAQKSAKAEYEWRCADYYVTGSPAGLVVEHFCDILNGVSDGRIHVKYYGSGVLGSYEETLDATARGELEFCMISPYSSYHPLLGLKGIPFAGTTYDRVDKLFFGDGIIRKICDDGWAELGLKRLVTIDGAMFCYCCVKKPLVTPEDFAAMKFRVPPAEVYTKCFERIAPKSTAVVLPWAEFYSALERGVVDGGPAFWNTYESMKFNEVAPYFTDVNQNFNFDDILMNADLFESLPQDLKDVVLEAAFVAEDAGRARLRSEWEASKQRCIAGGATIIELTSEQRNKFVELVKPEELWVLLYADMLEKYYPGQNMFQKLVEEVKAVEGMK